MFKCPICGNDSYSISMRTHNVFKCDGCSVIFEEPGKFGKTRITKDDKSTIIISGQDINIAVGKK